MKNNIYIIIGVIIVILSVLLFVYFDSQNGEIVTQKNVQDQRPQNIEYTNKDWGVEFSYPSNLTRVEEWELELDKNQRESIGIDLEQVYSRTFKLYQNTESVASLTFNSRNFPAKGPSLSNVVGYEESENLYSLIFVNPTGSSKLDIKVQNTISANVGTFILLANKDSDINGPANLQPDDSYWVAVANTKHSSYSAVIIKARKSVFGKEAFIDLLRSIQL